MLNLPEPKKLKIALLPGDGIGIEVTEAAVPLFNELELSEQRKDDLLRLNALKLLGLHA